MNGVAVVGDVTDPDGARQVVDTAHTELGGLDRVANIVGLATFVEDVFAIDRDIWEHDLRINLSHHFYVSRAAARHMIDDGTGGAFALVASVSGFYGAAGHAAYGAAKAGADVVGAGDGERMGRSRHPCQLRGARCHSHAEVDGGPQMPPEDPVGDEIVLGRWGRPVDIAGPLVFLLSELSSFMTGRTLVVDGGSMIHFPHGVAQQASPRTG